VGHGGRGYNAPAVPLAPPPPPRSRRLRILTFRVVVAFVTPVAIVAVLLAWQPWHGAPRKPWEAAPAVPARPTPAETRWLNGLEAWIGFVRDAVQDPTHLAVRDCSDHLARLRAAPNRLEEVRLLAGDTCKAFTAAAVDRRGSDLSWDVKRAGRANAEDAEAQRDLRLLVSSLGVRRVPGGRVVGRYSRIAAKLSGGDATVRCWDSRANWVAVSNSMARTEPRMRNLLGFAVPSERRIELSPSVCASLAGIPHGRVPVEAIEVLTHESEHLVGPDGIANEAKVDCYAAQRMHVTGAALGVSSAAMRRGAVLYLRFEQPLLPPEYRSADCRSGGAYDLTPHDGHWP
jgi:hypothetical protein